MATLVDGSVANSIAASDILVSQQANADGSSTLQFSVVNLAQDDATAAATALQSNSQAVYDSAVVEAAPTVTTAYFDSPPPPPLPLGAGESYLATLTFEFEVTQAEGRRMQFDAGLQLYAVADVASAIQDVVRATGYTGILTVTVAQVGVPPPQKFAAVVVVDGEKAAEVHSVVSELSFTTNLAARLGATSVTLTSEVVTVVTVAPAPSPPPPQDALGDEGPSEEGSNVELINEDGGLSATGIAIITVMVLLCCIIVIIIPGLIFVRNKRTKKKEVVVGEGEGADAVSATQV